MVDALDHVLDYFTRGVPDAELFAQLRVEGFEEGLVEVGDGFLALEDVEETGLDAVEGFSGQFKYLRELDGIEVMPVGDFAEELTQDGNFEVVVGKLPVEDRFRLAAFGGMTPEYPGGKDAVEEGLDKGGAEEMLAFFALKLDAERLFQRDLHVMEGGKVMVFSARPGFAGVGGEQPRNLFRLGERHLVKHDALEEVRQKLVMLGVDGTVPEVVRRDGKFIAFEGARLTIGLQSQEAELMQVGDEHGAVLPQVAQRLFTARKGIEVAARRLDLDDAALRVTQQRRLGVARRAIGLGKEAAVGHACSLLAELG